MFVANKNLLVPNEFLTGSGTYIQMFSSKLINFSPAVELRVLELKRVESELTDFLKTPKTIMIII